jgi:hypothetical protein
MSWSKRRSQISQAHFTLRCSPGQSDEEATNFLDHGYCGSGGNLRVVLRASPRPALLSACVNYTGRSTQAHRSDRSRKNSGVDVTGGIGIRGARLLAARLHRAID